MSIKRLAALVTAIAIVLTSGGLAACGKANAGEHELNSLVEGVYSSNYEKDIFDIEITSMTAIVQTADPAATASKSVNKLLRWGISRRQNGQTPAADPGAPDLLKKYNAIYIGDTTKKKVYLTFDEGYENGHTAKILDVLKDKGVKAVFFITGPYLKDQEALVKRMIDEGHIIGNHTIHHPSLPTLNSDQAEEEILGLNRALEEKFKLTPKYIRPPKGEYSENTLALVQKLGMRSMFWSFAYDDWYRDKTRGSQFAYEMVMNNLHNGGVLLLHAVSKDNAEALASIIEGIRSKGFEIGNPDEL